MNRVIARCFSRRRFLALCAAGGFSASKCWPYGQQSSGAAAARDILRAKISEILILPHCHADFAYGHPRDWHEKRYNLVLNEALDLLRADSSFRYMFDAYWDFLEPFLRLSPGRIADTKRYMRENKIGIHGGQLANAKPDQVGGELYIRNLGWGKKRYKELFPEKNIVVGSTFDNCYGYLQIPQILRLAGYKYWWFSRVHDPFKGGGEMWKDGIPREFIFKGLDGTEVIASRVGYGGLMSDIVPPAVTSWDEKVDYFWNRQYSPGNAIKDIVDQCKAGVIAVPQGSDDARPLRRRTPTISYGRYDVLADSAETYLGIQEFLKEWQEKEQITLRFATPEEYFAKVEASRSKLPVVGKEIVKWADQGDPGNGLLGSKDFQWWWGRAERKLLSLEKTNAFLRLAGMEPVVAGKAIDDLWFDLCSTTGHAKWCVFSADFDREFAKIGKVHDQAQAALHRTLTAISRRVPVGENAAIPLVVFNLSSWERTDKVEVTVDLPRGTTASVEVTDGVGRVPSEAEFVSRRSDGSIERVNLAFMATIPPLGYKVHYLKPAPGTLSHPVEVPLTQAFAFENEWYKATVSPNGRLLFLLEKSSKTLLIDGSGAVGIYFNLPEPRTSPAFSERSGQRIEPVHDLAFVRQGPTRTEIAAAGAVRIKGVEDRLTERISFYRDSPLIDWNFEVTTHGGYGGAYVVDVPLALGDAFPATVTADTPFGVEDKSAVDVFWCRHWVDVSCGKAGVTVINEPGRGKYAIVRDAANRGVILRHPTLPCVDMSSSTLYKERSPAWTGGGTHQFKLTLYPHASGWKEARVWQRGQAAADPFVAIPAAPRESTRRVSGSLPQQHGFLDVTPANLVLSALGADQDHLYLRFYETSGAPSHFKVQLDKKFGNAWETNFFDQRLNDAGAVRIVPSGNGCAIEGSPRPWEIVNLCIKR